MFETLVFQKSRKKILEVLYIYIYIFKGRANMGFLIYFLERVLCPQRILSLDVKVGD